MTSYTSDKKVFNLDQLFHSDQPSNGGHRTIKKLENSFIQSLEEIVGDIHRR